MRFLSLLGLAGLVAQAIAQTPPGSSPATNNNLPVRYGTTNVTPGLRLTREATANLPTISFVPRASNQTFILFFIDLTLNAAALNISTLNATSQLPLVPGLGANRTTILHFEQTGVKFSANGTLQNTTSPLAYYLGPNPPAGDIAHTYVWYLYEQQAIFRGPSTSPYPTTTSRISFNLTNIVRSPGIGSLLAANYLTVQNNATANATGTASSTAAASASRTGVATASVTPFRGAAATVASGIEGTIAVVLAAGMAALML